MAELIDYLSEKYQQQSLDEVNRRLLELSSLFEISQLLNESLELPRVLNNVLLIPMGRLMITRGAIILKIKDQCKIVMSKGIPGDLEAVTFTWENTPYRPFVFGKLNEEHDKQRYQAFFDFAQTAKLEISIPFICKNQPLGLMMFGPKLNRSEFNEDEINFLNSLANIAATTIENALQVEEIKEINEEIREINKQLAGKIQELRTLFDIGKGLLSTLDSPKIIRLLTYALMGQMTITKYTFLLKSDSFLNVYENKGFPEVLLENIAKALNNISPPDSAMPPERLEDEALVNYCQKSEIKVIIPMQHQDKLLGYICLGPKISGQQYTETDYEFLTTLVSQAVISLENARLFQETLEKQRLEEELNLARNIQKKLLPKSIPEVTGYEIFGMNSSSKQVGGDYYDVIPIDDHHIALAIGDVSGKGVPASLLMANLQAALRVMITLDMDLAEVVAKLNTLIHANTDLDKFITFFIGILNTREHSFKYVNAGHNNPHYLSADAEVNFLDVGGILLGIMPHYTYQTGEIQLRKGEIVLTYTDGVNEALNPEGEEFGDARLHELSLSLKNKPVKQMVETIWKTIDEYSAGEPQADDVTMLALRRLP